MKLVANCVTTTGRKQQLSLWSGQVGVVCRSWESGDIISSLIL